MTDQERPVEERNELLDDLLTAATNVAVDEQDQSQQPAVDKQPEPAAQPVTAPDAEATQAEDVPAATEQSADIPVARADEFAPATPIEASDIESDAIAEAPAAAAAAAPQMSAAAAAVEATPIE